MNNHIEKVRILEHEKLNSEHYFQSLLEQARRKGLLSDTDIERIQYESIRLLSYKTTRFTSGESSSIQVEKAQSIMASNFFTIGICLKSCISPEDAVAFLQNEPIDDLYRKGRKMIDTMILKAKSVHETIQENLVKTQNVFYRSTIVDGINGFFRSYDADYQAHEIHITADYPIFNPMPRLAGIEFIVSYLDALYFENLFCSFFPAEDIHHLLCGYLADYKEHVINIYEWVLITAAGCSIAGTDIEHLNLTEEGKAYLISLFSEMKPEDVNKKINEVSDELSQYFSCSRKLALYIKNSMVLIAGKINFAVKENMLRRIFLTPSFPERNPKIIFSHGDKMENEQYRKVLEQIEQCENIGDKIDVMKTSVHSFADLEDILADAMLKKKEIKDILKALSMTEIAVLIKKYPQETLADITDYREQESILIESLHEYVGYLPKEQQESIISASKRIEG